MKVASGNAMKPRFYKWVIGYILFSAKVRAVLVISENTFLYLCLSQWFEVGRAQLEKGGVMCILDKSQFRNNKINLR